MFRYNGQLYTDADAVTDAVRADRNTLVLDAAGRDAYAAGSARPFGDDVQASRAFARAERAGILADRIDRVRRADTAELVQAVRTFADEYAAGTMNATLANGTGAYDEHRDAADIARELVAHATAELAYRVALAVSRADAYAPTAERDTVELGTGRVPVPTA